MSTIESRAKMVEESIRLLKLPTDELPGLYEPIVYGLGAGGKRLRPVLVLITAEGFGTPPETAILQAIGLETFHNFTLLHDDVMDNSPLRRGRPTVHTKWDANTAILSGDTMLTLATDMMMQVADHQLRPVLAAFNSMAIKVYEGQARDMDFETRSDVTLDEYMTMIGDKTGALLGCACRVGAIIMDAGEKSADAMYDYGFKLGLAFQIQDDYLDVYGDEASFGKPIGGDIANRKKTYLYLRAQEVAPAETAEAFADPEERYRAVRALYDGLGIREMCQAAVARFSGQAIQALDESGIAEEQRDMLANLVEKLVARCK